MIGYILLILVAALVAPAKAQVDELTLFKNLCANKDHRIREVSSIVGLSRLASSGEALEAGLAKECIELYREPLVSLADIVGDDELSVCSQRMVTKMYKFHWKYMIGKMSNKWAREVQNTVPNLPNPLFAFFLDYATQVSGLCMDGMFHQLDLATGNEHDQILEELKGKLNWGVNIYKSILVTKDRVRRFDSFMLYWMVSITSMLRQGQLDVDAIDEDKDLLFGAIKSGDPTSIWKMQDLCRYKLRPIYQDTVHPVMRLIDLGYVGRPLDDERFKDNEPVKSWYHITQVCELILGLEYVKDPTLEVNKFVNMYTKPEDGQEYERHKYELRQNIPSNDRVTKIRGPEKLNPTNNWNLMIESTGIKWRMVTRSYVPMRMFHNLFLNHLKNPISTVKIILNQDEQNPSKDESIENLIEEEKKEVAREEADMSEELMENVHVGVESSEDVRKVHEVGLRRRKREEVNVIFVGGGGLAGLITLLAILGVIYVIHGPFTLSGLIVLG